MPCSLEATWNAPGQARRVVTDAIRGVDRSLLDDVRLVVSELVTNALVHSEPPLEAPMLLHVLIDDEVLRFELRYSGVPFRPNPSLPDLDSERGRGLYIVDRLTRRWGVETEEGLLAWAEWDIASQIPPGAAGHIRQTR